MEKRPVTAPEVDHDAKTIDNYHLFKPRSRPGRICFKLANTQPALWTGFVAPCLGQSQEITPRDTWSRRQSGDMKSVHRAGWVLAVGFTPAAKAAWAECTCAGAAHKHFSLILCYGGFLVPASSA